MNEISNNSRLHSLNLVHAEYAAYKDKVINLQDKNMAYPRNISIETLVLCNAKCGFCPYPNSPRKQQKLSNDIFFKIIKDLKDIPISHRFGLTLSRINEPLLDKRMKKFSFFIKDNLPNAIQTIWTNGTSITSDNINWIKEIPKSTISISLNSMDEDEHLEIMGIPLKPVLKKLDYLHQLCEKGAVSSTIKLYAPFITEEKSVTLKKSCDKRYPLFKLGIRPIFTWMGGSTCGESEKLHSEISKLNYVRAKKLPCAQWFDLHILANGYVTKCCIDETGYKDPKYFVGNDHCLNIYNMNINLRKNLPNRDLVRECRNCTHLG